MLLAAAAALSISACGGASATTAAPASSGAASSKKAASSQSASSSPASSAKSASSAASEKIAELASFHESLKNTKGYSEDVSLTFYGPVLSTGAAIAHPAESSATIPAVTGAKKTKNTWIMPFAATVQNTTSGFDTVANMKLSVVIKDAYDSGRISGLSVSAAPYKDFSAETRYYIDSEKTWETATLQSWAGTDQYIGSVKWNSLKSGNRGRLLGYCVFYDVYSPRCPDGLPFYFWPDFYFTLNTKLGGAQDDSDSQIFSLLIMKQDDGTAAGSYVIYDNTKDRDKITAQSKADVAALKASDYMKK